MFKRAMNDAKRMFANWWETATPLEFALLGLVIVMLAIGATYF